MSPDWNAPRWHFSPVGSLGWNVPRQCRGAETAIHPEFFQTYNHILQQQLATICAEKPWRNSLLTRRSRWSVGFTKKSTHARGKLCCKLLEGCYTVQRQLQVATIVAKSRTGFYFVQRCAQQKKMRCKLPRYPVTPRNSSATCNATVLRCKLL